MQTLADAGLDVGGSGQVRQVVERIAIKMETPHGAQAGAARRQLILHLPCVEPRFRQQFGQDQRGTGRGNVQWTFSTGKIHRQGHVRDVKLGWPDKDGIAHFHARAITRLDARIFMAEDEIGFRYRRAAGSVGFGDIAFVQQHAGAQFDGARGIRRRITRAGNQGVAQGGVIPGSVLDDLAIAADRLPVQRYAGRAAHVPLQPHGLAIDDLDVISTECLDDGRGIRRTDNSR